VSRRVEWGDAAGFLDFFYACGFAPWPDGFRRYIVQRNSQKIDKNIRLLPRFLLFLVLILSRQFKVTVK
jgi:hypothetical protein